MGNWAQSIRHWLAQRWPPNIILPSPLVKHARYTFDLPGKLLKTGSPSMKRSLRYSHSAYTKQTNSTSLLSPRISQKMQKVFNVRRLLVCCGVNNSTSMILKLGYPVMPPSHHRRPND